MKVFCGKWKRDKSGALVMKWKRRKVKHLTVLDVLPE